MTLEVPNLFVILAFAFFFGPMLICGMCACLKSFWRVKRKKKERHAETFVTDCRHVCYVNELYQECIYFDEKNQCTAEHNQEYKEGEDDIDLEFDIYAEEDEATLAAIDAEEDEEE